MNIPDFVKGIAIVVEPVGSRVTCNPPPTDTDEDYLVLVSRTHLSLIFETLRTDNWTLDGSEITDEVNCIREEDRFYSFKRESVNLIITRSPSFFFRFMAASGVAKRLNLLSKPDRVALFQAVLYGNPCDEPVVMPVGAFGETAQ